MTIETINGIRVLRPEAGMVITNGEFMSHEVWLGVDDDASKYYEMAAPQEPETELDDMRQALNILGVEGE